MNRLFVFIFSFALIGLSASAQQPEGQNAGQGEQVKRRGFRPHFDATNPDVHDPVMAYEDGKYYIFSTGMGISVMSSSDMKTWQREKPVFEHAPQWALEQVEGYRGHTWAPDIQKVGDTWYLYYSCSSFGKNSSAIGLVTNKTLNPESPLYKWEDQGMVIESKRGFKWNAIDPNLILDKKGNPWLSFGSFWDGIQLVPLDKDFKTPIGKVRTIARHRDPEAMEKKAGNSNEIEAPFIVQKDGYFYLFTSTGLCCRGLRSTYRTEVGRSKKITGPYKNRDGKKMLKGAGSLLIGRSDAYAGVGHCGVYEFDGQWYYIAHGYDTKLNGASKLVLKKIRWEDGWPMVENEE